MKKKALWGGLILILLLLVIYVTGSIYFANILMSSKTATIAESQSK